MLRITLAQLNMTVGDISGNVRKMEAAARQAHEAQADLVVFPELSLCGYYPEDMLDEPAFLARCERGLQELLSATQQWPGLYWVVGAPMPAKRPGKRLHNSLLVLQDGQVKLQYDKQLLPTYNIFDERRHFEPGRDVAKVLRVGEAQVGFIICEDGWNDSGNDYDINPFERMADAAPDVVVSINASPSNIGRREQRHQVFSSAAKRHGLPIVDVNQVGGHDQIVFDGASFAVEPEAGVVFEAHRFEEHTATLQLSRGCFAHGDGSPTKPVPAQGLSTMAFYRAQIILGLRDYARRCGFRQVVVGSSGGIDSALTLALAAEALGPENVTAITMPSRISSSGSVDDSVALCHNLGIELIHHPIGELVDAYGQQFQASFGEPLAGLTLENLQARVRGTVLMEYSNCYGHLLLTTGNSRWLLHLVWRHQWRPGAAGRPLQNRGVCAGAPHQRQPRARGDSPDHHRQAAFGRTGPGPKRPGQPATLPPARCDFEAADRRQGAVRDRTRCRARDREHAAGHARGPRHG